VTRDPTGEPSGERTGNHQDSSGRHLDTSRTGMSTSVIPTVGEEVEGFYLEDWVPRRQRSFAPGPT
jgi:hypothetical protein